MELGRAVKMDGSKGKMLGSTEDASSGSTQSGGATSAHERVCYCGRPMIVRTAHTDQNYGRRFVSCENWKVSSYFFICFPTAYPKILGYIFLFCLTCVMGFQELFLLCIRCIRFSGNCSDKMKEY